MKAVIAAFWVDVVGGMIELSLLAVKMEAGSLPRSTKNPTSTTKA
jgi:hypothetical protein